MVAVQLIVVLVKKHFLIRSYYFERDSILESIGANMKLSINRQYTKYFAIGILAFLHTCSKIYVVSNSKSTVTVIQYCQYVDYLLMLSSLELKGYKDKELCLYALLGIFGIILAITSGEAMFLSMISIVTISKKGNYDKICKVLLDGTSVAFLLSCVLYMFGVSDSGLKKLDAIALGFGHPNVCGSVISSMVLLYFTLHKERIGARQWILLAVAILVSVLFLHSRTTIVLLLLLPVLRWLLLLFLKKESKVIEAVVCLLPLIIFTFILYTTKNFDSSNKFYSVLDILLTGRLTLNHYNYQRIGFGILGQHFEIDRTALQGRNTIDCSYLMVLLKFGIAGTVVFLASYTFALLKIMKGRRFTLLSVTILILLAGVTENIATEIILGFPLIFLADLKVVTRYMEGERNDS